MQLAPLRRGPDRGEDPEAGAVRLGQLQLRGGALHVGIKLTHIP
jgi:hypothetical protein